jgi:hypothetical protein
MGEAEQTIMTHAEAKARGLKRYFSGKPCKNGNVAPRYTAGNGCLCVACAAERSARASAWQKDPANKDRVQAIAARKRESGKTKVWAKASYRRHSEKRIATMVEWQRNNPERARATRKRWADKNPEAVKAAFARASARRSKATQMAKPPWWSKWDRFVIAQAKELAKLRTQMTGIAWEIDHLIPLQARRACGLHCAENIQVIPQALNQWKRERLVLTERGEWIKHT